MFVIREREILMREEFVDVIVVLVQEILHIAIFHIRMDQFEFLSATRHFYEETQIDQDQAEIHDGGRIGTYDQGIDHEDETADTVDDAKLEDAGHHKGYQYQQGSEIADHFDNEFFCHNSP